jgi:hypothetical protein
VRLGAEEVTNSFGIPERVEPKKVLNAFNHPGVVITASTGDDGWYGWDLANNPSPPDVSQNAAEFPATDPTVVAVGGTELELNKSDASIAEQTVWNENGVEDASGSGIGPKGATGGGCSTTFASPTWQSKFPGYKAAHCAGKRLAADVSADADPATGLDVYDSWGNGDSGWLTGGGGALASPIIAAMYALAGGSGGALYPAASLYQNARTNPTLVYDVAPTEDGAASGNSFCGGEDPGTCGTDVYNTYGLGTHNPNAIGGRNVDCSFPLNHSDPARARPRSSQCNAVTGYDGPTGVGTPFGGLLAPTSPAVSLRAPKAARRGKPAKFTVKATERLKHQHITRISFSWGDGTSSNGKARSRTHTYQHNGRYVVEVIVTDSAGQRSLATTTVKVR